MKCCGPRRAASRMTGMFQSIPVLKACTKEPQGAQARSFLAASLRGRAFRQGSSLHRKGIAIRWEDRNGHAHRLPVGVDSRLPGFEHCDAPVLRKPEGGSFAGGGCANGHRVTRADLLDADSLIEIAASSFCDVLNRK